MKKILFPFTFILLLALCACAPSPAADTVTQYSTYSALHLGLYDGEITIKELSQHGNFGLGTFDGLDGEMVVLDGTFYQASVDGSVQEASPGMTSPFADVHFFKPDQKLTLEGPLPDYAALQAVLDGLGIPANLPVAFRISGTFDYLKWRSVPAQSEPYLPLADVVAQQTIFEGENLTGTLVGYRFPDFIEPVGASGYHFHFISDDHQQGGHVLDCRFSNAALSVDMLDQVLVMVPENAAFQGADFSAEE